MNNFFSDFKKSSASEWKEQIIKDLKGKDHSLLEYNDPIEDLEYKAYYNEEEIPAMEEVPGVFPFERGSKTKLNDWANAALVIIESEETANKKALEYLMKGADMLVFRQVNANCNWNNVLKGIQFEYIKIQFDILSIKDYQSIVSLTGKNNNTSFCFDLLSQQDSLLLSALADEIKEKQHPVLLVNGFGVQQSGATTWQEIAFCLNTGHEYLLQLMESGLSIDQAAACIHFHLGTGSNYFYEIAKFRVIRKLWSKVINAYRPEHKCTYNCMITAITGHTNKSLRDPYTNLLRQTTEAMSAAGSADAILVLPYDLYSVNGSAELAQRMALNISLILKEESYLDKVLDPAGGSYSIEQLTDAIGRKAWTYFQSIESDGGLFEENTLNQFKEEVETKRTARIQAFTEGKIVGIGMNKYPDPNEKEDQWNTPEPYLGMAALVFDRETKTSMA